MNGSNKKRLVIGYWSCPYCDTKNIRGNLRNCPNCGKARDNSTQFYLNPLKIEYASDEENRTVNRNSDWICIHCNQLNSDNDKHCISCGSVRTSENSTYSKHNNYSVTSSGAIIPDKPANPNVDNEKTSEFKASDKRTHTSKSNNILNFISKYKVAILSSLAIILVIASLVFAFTPRYYDVVVTGFSWERNINIEKWQTVNESDWILPANARLQYSRQEFSHYQQVLDHYETQTRQVARQRVSHYENYISGYRDLGNGYFEEITSSRPVYETYYETETYQEPVYRNEPVYRTKYYYEIDKWLYERSVFTKNNDKTPYWGNLNLSSVERVASRNEYYYITVFDLKNEETKTYPVSYEDWTLLELKEITTLKVTLGAAEIFVKEQE